MINPTPIPNSNTTRPASQGGTPLEINDIKAILEDPMMKGIDKSSPPNRATSVCPIVAKPKKAAKTNMDFMLRRERNPGMVSDPIINNPIKTQIPINTFF